MDSVFPIVFWIAALAVLGFLIFVKFKKGEANSNDGVVASLETGALQPALRLTKDALLEGFGAEAPRHSLAGLSARSKRVGPSIVVSQRRG